MGPRNYELNFNPNIFRGNVSEEEDFQLFGVSNLGVIDNPTETQVVGLLKESEDELVRRSRIESNAEV